MAEKAVAMLESNLRKVDIASSVTAILQEGVTEQGPLIYGDVGGETSPLSGSISTPSSSLSASTRSSPLNPLAQAFQTKSSAPLAVPTSASTVSKLYELRKVPGKGLGLFATSFIPVGTRIICESPLLIILDNHLHLAWGSYCRLSNAKKLAFDKLHCYVPEQLSLEYASRRFLIDPSDTNMDEEDIREAIAEHVRVMGIFACNNFKMPRGLGVFETASRLNHSCVPNVHHSYNPTLQKQTVHAARDILSGEELCTTYIGGSGDYYVRAQRIDILQRGYGFTCYCGSCTDITGTADGRRELLGHIAWGLQQHLESKAQGMPFVPTSPATALLQAKDLITILLAEGLYCAELMKAYRTASTQALAAEEYATALEFAHNEMEVQSNLLGTEVDDLKKNGADSSLWIKHVRGVMKTAGLLVDASDGSVDHTEKAKPQKASRKKKKYSGGKKGSL